MTGIHRTVIPAQVGIQPACVLHWIPACAGMTAVISGSMLSDGDCFVLLSIGSLSVSLNMRAKDVFDDARVRGRTR